MWNIKPTFSGRFWLQITWVILMLLPSLGCHSSRATTTRVVHYNVTQLDFRPKNHDWRIDWPRRPWRFGDETYFIPELKIEPFAHQTLELEIRIYEDRSFRRDVHIGTLWAIFFAGRDQPQYFSHAPDEWVKYRGFPPGNTRNKFWLLYTPTGRIKGNAGEGSRGDCKVYLRVMGDSWANGRITVGSADSPIHVILRN
ncbi:MAG: hypothetical protein V3T77_10945 [Planctomycetota bacterium]